MLRNHPVRPNEWPAEVARATAAV